MTIDFIIIAVLYIVLNIISKLHDYIFS